MTHTYAKEKATRLDYTEQTKLRLAETLRRPDVRSALGSGALGLQELADTLYAPEVSDDGVVTLTLDQRASNWLPVLALRSGEQVRRDKTFVTLTARQMDNVPDDKLMTVDLIARRVIAGPEEPYIAQTFGQAGCVAATMRMIYGLPGYPTSDDVTYFNFRPLITVEYDPNKPAAGAPQMISALVMADQVLANPLTTVASPEEFDALNAEWSAAGAAAEASVRALDS